MTRWNQGVPNRRLCDICWVIKNQAHVRIAHNQIMVTHDIRGDDLNLNPSPTYQCLTLKAIHTGS